MKLVRLTTVTLTALLLMPFNLYAEKGTGKTAEEASKTLKPQTHCLVMGGESKPGLHVDIQGQRVYLCCPMCEEKIKADPDKYFTKAAGEGVLFENIQTTCPVSGEKLGDKPAFVDYEGRHVALCCEDCRDSFNADPQKYLKLLDNPSEEKAGHEHHGHESHPH